MASSTSPSREAQVKDPPKDGISSVEFAPDCDSVVASSWDSVSAAAARSEKIRNRRRRAFEPATPSCLAQRLRPARAPLFCLQSVRVYDSNCDSVATFFHNAAVLDASFGSSSGQVFSGGLDRLVRAWDVTRGSGSKGDALGEHGKPIKCIKYCSALNVVASGSWDATIATWDARQSGSSGARAASISAPERIYSMDYNDASGQPLLAAACAGQNLAVYDLRKPDAAVMSTKLSSLKHMLRCVKFWKDGTGVAVSSIEGRVALEPLPGHDTVAEGARSLRFSFKCHRKRPAGADVDVVYPVNSLAVHPVHDTVATAGGDGSVVVWDRLARKKVHTYAPYATSVSATAFSRTGAKLAVAVSYDHSMGADGAGAVPPDALFIRDVQPQEVQPKAKR